MSARTQPHLETNTYWAIDEVYGRAPEDPTYPCLVELLEQYDYGRHHALCAGVMSGTDVLLVGCLAALSVARYGDLDTGAAWLAKVAAAVETQLNPEEDFITYFVVGAMGCLVASRWFQRAAGLAEAGSRLLKSLMPTWDDGVDEYVDSISAMAPLGSWSNEGDAGCCYHGEAVTHFKDCLKIQWFLCADDAGLEDTERLRAAFASWLPQSGCYSDGSSFIAPIFEAGLPDGDYMDAYMRCGRYGDALDFGSVVKPNFPFSPVIQASLAVWTGRALAAVGQPDEAERAFKAAVSDMQVSRLHFMELLARRELQAHVLEPAAGRSSEQASALSELLSDRSKLCLPAERYTRALGVDGMPTNPWNSSVAAPMLAPMLAVPPSTATRQPEPPQLPQPAKSSATDDAVAGAPLARGGRPNTIFTAPPPPSQLQRHPMLTPVRRSALTGCRPAWRRQRHRRSYHPSWRGHEWAPSLRSRSTRCGSCCSSPGRRSCQS